MEKAALVEVIVGLGLMITVFAVGFVRAQFITNEEA